MIKQEKEILDQ